MIKLYKLTFPENATLFTTHPELNKIWENPTLQEHAKSSYERHGVDPEESTGEIFLIMDNDETVGIIGWFTYDEIFIDTLRLRYYGIVPSKRGRDHGEKAIQLLLQRLSQVAPAEYAWFAESVSVQREVAPRIVAHFKKMGFQEFDDPEYGENAGCGPVLSLRIRIPGR